MQSQDAGVAGSTCTTTAFAGRLNALTPALNASIRPADMSMVDGIFVDVFGCWCRGCHSDYPADVCLNEVIEKRWRLCGVPGRRMWDVRRTRWWSPRVARPVFGQGESSFHSSDNIRHGRVHHILSTHAPVRQQHLDHHLMTGEHKA